MLRQRVSSPDNGKKVHGGLACRPPNGIRNTDVISKGDVLG